MTATDLQIILVAALIAHYVIELVSGLLNVRSLAPEVPPEFRSVVDETTHARTQAYTRARTRFSLVGDTAGLLALLGFWWLGGFGHLDRAARLAGLGPVGTGLIYIGAPGLASVGLRLPFRFYDTFVLEDRFGFNRTDAWTFWTDLLKELALAMAVGGPLLVAVLALFQWAGDAAWIWCWAATAAFMMVVQFVAPAWILPLFNRFQPLEPGELRDAITAYARSVAFPLEGVYVMDGSRRSTKGNAFFTGFGRHKRIALFDTLMAKQTVPELVSIIAHEIGHHKRHHVQIGLLLGFAHTGVLFWLVSLALDYRPLYDAFFVSVPSTYSGLVLFGLLFGPLELPLSIVLHALSRRHEYQADAFAVDTTRRPQALADALKKLSAENIANLTPHRLSVWLHYSHPPLRDRIAALASSRR